MLLRVEILELLRGKGNRPSLAVMMGGEGGLVGRMRGAGNRV